VLAVLVLSGCSAVPSSSTPQVVRTLNVNTAPSSIAPPAAGADQREIVSGFLDANASDDESHLAALQYLTPAAQQSWKFSSGAIILDARSPSIPDPRTGDVTLAGTEVGELSAAGVFTLPSAPFVPQTFRFKKINQEWRITNPPSGLLLRAQAFSRDYRLWPLYFFNAQETVLVPDLRYTSTYGQSLADWLLTELLAGPQAGPLTNLPNEFPSQIDQTRAKVTYGTPITVQLPGISRVSADNRTQIAAELAFSFDAAFPGRALELLDGTTVVTVAGGQTTFSRTSMPASYDPASSNVDQSVYYIRNKAVYNSSGHSVVSVSAKGGLGSVAVSNDVVGKAPLIAAVSADRRTLYVGTSASLHPVKLSTRSTVVATSRPDWTRDRSAEVWLGVGRVLDRVSNDGTVRPVTVSAPQGTGPLPPRTITAVRFSPDGARVALVLAGTGKDTAASAWLGNVVRSGSTAQVQDLHQFSPTSWHVRDVSWTSPVSLDVIDNAPTSLQFRIFSVRCDGSNAQVNSSASQDLPNPPRWITADSGDAAWVSVSSGTFSTLWRESSGGWQAALGSSFYVGSAPAYSS